ncbi:MAG: hypothetical protein IJI68_02685 [Eggerthellaceae bacterium]|nr:hypothetical protein [Eggerthellaceae bacterium]
MPWICSCGNSRYKTGTEKTVSSTSVNKAPTTNEKYRNSFKAPEPERYADARWPTTNQELLAIPEEQRWYNAWNSVETTCTIVGPVVDVYQATDEYGMPIFVTIGVDYPNPDSVTLVVWADEEEAFDSTLHAIDHGNAWIAVTSYLTTYNGYLQFSSDNYVEWKNWTGVS